LKAARIHRFGPPDVIELEELPLPEPDPMQRKMALLSVTS